MQSIERRILNAMIYIVHVRKWRPRAIYLNEHDMAQLAPQYRRSIDGIPVRSGKHSTLYGDAWHGRSI